MEKNHKAGSSQIASKTTLLDLGERAFSEAAFWNEPRTAVLNPPNTAWLNKVSHTII